MQFINGLLTWIRQWTWKHGRLPNVGAIMAVQRQKRRMRILLIPPTPTISLVCGSILLALTFVSIMIGPLIDLRHFPNHSGPPPVPINLAVETRNPDASKLRLSELEDVPTQGDRSNLWASKFSEFYYGCSEPSRRFTSAVHDSHSKHYLMIAASGGLNQQRTGITDAVVVARMLNATLVVPKLDQKSFWKDKSNFGDIFDVDWFISSLSKDVVIVKELPEKFQKVVGRSHGMRVPRKCTQHCYENRVLPVLLKRHVVELTKFDYRLANKLDTDLQKLRCKVNYHALQFTNSISEMGQKLVDRMKKRSRHFLALHLRFEPDMLAFSGCYYGGGDKERRELGAIRKRWKTLHISSPDKERRHGKCPLTPQEVGLMLRALGFGSDLHLYVASGEVYGGEETLAPLKALFPNFYTKDTLASKEELEPFSSYSSRMAALDYIVCDQSDVFVTNNNGNMARMLAGRRRYFGHKPTIRPNAKKLNSLFLNRRNMTWDAFASKVRACQKGFMGEPNEVRPGRGEFHEYPFACICEHPDAKERIEAILQHQSKSKSKNVGGLPTQNVEVHTEDESVVDDTDWLEKDEFDDNSQTQQRAGREDYNPFIKTDEPELEEMLSD